MKRNEQRRNAIDTFFFHCERGYTAKEKSREMPFTFCLSRSERKSVLREGVAFSLSSFESSLYSPNNHRINL